MAVADSIAAQSQGRHAHRGGAKIAEAALPRPWNRPMLFWERMNDHASVVVHDVRLFDGEVRHERVTVVAVDGVITHVVPGGGPAVLPHADVVDGTGRTLLPGLI